MEAKAAMATVPIEAPGDEGLGRQGQRGGNFLDPQRSGGEIPPGRLGMFRILFPLCVKRGGPQRQLLAKIAQIINSADRTRRREPRQKCKCA